MNIFNLFAKLTLDRTDYKQGIQEAKQESQDFAQKTNQFLKTIATNAWVELGKTVINVASKIANATLDLVNYADTYGDLSAKYDISTKSLQEFDYIASQNGATLETLLSSMTMMYNRAKEDAEVFSQLGVSVRDTNGNMKAMDTLFWEVKSALDNVTSSGDQSALMLESFGRSAMSIGEVLRKDTEELKALAQEANDLGIILSEDVPDKAGAFNDFLDGMRLRGKTAFTEFLAGAEGSEEKLNEFLYDVMGAVEKYLPQLTRFGIKVLAQVIVAVAKSLPDIVDVLVDELLKINWLEVGLNIAKALVQGLAKGLMNTLGTIFGKGWLWGKDEGDDTTGEMPIGDRDIMPTGSYEVSERSSKSIEVKVSASGTSAIDEQNAKVIAKELAPYIDKELGGV